MKNFQNNAFSIGILGGGQLGRMIIQAGIDLNIHFSVLDPDSNAPCKDIVPLFEQGNFSDFDTVYNFGKKVNLLTIEIEHVSIEALEKLEKEGLTVYPQSSVLKIIQDKGLQKQFYNQNNLPTGAFSLHENAEEIKKSKPSFPFVQKLRKGGYDGKGVQIIHSKEDLIKLFNEPSVIEQYVPFQKELAVIVAANASGEIKAFPPVEMAFHPTANLVEFLFSPAQITVEQTKEAVQIAKDVAKKLDIVGLLAVELFLTNENRILINEIAPRPHNSGHQTIEGNFTSQYQQHLRAILNLPLGDTATIMPSAMVNILGAEGHTGIAQPEGLESVMSLSGVYPHFYGKTITKPFRKMGHCTILADNFESLKEKATFVKNTLRVISEK